MAVTSHRRWHNSPRQVTLWWSKNPAALLSKPGMGAQADCGPGMPGAPGEVNSAGERIALFICIFSGAGDSLLAKRLEQAPESRSRHEPGPFFTLFLSGIRGRGWEVLHIIGQRGGGTQGPLTSYYLLFRNVTNNNF